VSSSTAPSPRRRRLTPQPFELAELVAQLHSEAAPWLPCGLGSRLHWGPPVQDTELEISSAAHNRILHHARDDFTITVQAGMPLMQLEQELLRYGQWLAIDPPRQAGGEGGGSIGGFVARGLSGGLSHRYMSIRDRLIGIGLMRSDATSAYAGGRVVKNVAGYDLMRLLCHSWGSLALITDLTLRTYPLPPVRRMQTLHGDGRTSPATTEALNELRRWLVSSTLTPEAIDWRREPGTAPRLEVRIGSVSAEAVREQQCAIEERALPLGLRSLFSEADQPEEESAEGRTEWLARLAVASDRVQELLNGPELEGWHLRIGAASGIGDVWRRGGSPDAVQELRQRCQRLGGYLTLLLQPAQPGLAAWNDAPSRAIILAVKHQFDPLQQLARGRLPGVSRP